MVYAHVDVPPPQECGRLRRVLDGADVIYHGDRLIAVKRLDMPKWHVWRDEPQRVASGHWIRATCEEVALFEGLAIEGEVEN